MDPLTLGIVAFFLLAYTCKAVGQAVADGYRGAAKTAAAKTAALRNSNNPTDNALGWIGEQLGKVIGGTVRAGCAVGGAVVRGAQEGWQKGQEKGRQIRDDAKTNGRPRWQEAADWVRDRVQGRPRDGHRSLRERLRDWWNEGRDEVEATQTDRPDDPPAAGGNPGPGAPPPPPSGPTDPPPTPEGQPAEPEPAADGQPDQPEPPAPPQPPRPVEPERPAARDCPHTNKTTDHTTGTVTCDDCGEIFGAGTTPGGDMPTDTKAPSGEAQTYTQAKQAAAAYYGQATNYQTKATDGQVKCENLEERLRRLHDNLYSAGLGEATMSAVSGALEAAAAMTRSAQQLVAHTDTAISAANRVDTALTTHSGIAEAAATNRDGGDREFHGGAAEKR